MPPDKTDDELAEIFCDFFYDKIITIWKSLEKTRIYIPTEDRQISTMKQFDLFTEGQIRKLILSMPSKSCELDVIPTKLLKEPKVLDVLLPNICDIMNTSLSEGTFVDSWKLTIVRPLLKKQGLDLVESNYRPVSNLSFTSKVLEKLLCNSSTLIAIIFISCLTISRLTEKGSVVKLLYLS